MKNQGKKLLASILILSMILGSVTIIPKTVWAAGLAATAGTESITISGFTSGATLKLYLWVGGSLQNTASNVTGTTYTFTDVVPNAGGYYVTQTVGGEESVNSNWVNSILGVPIAIAGSNYVDVSGVHTGATVELYTEAGIFVTDTPTSQTAGAYHFGGLADGTSYYAIQKINGVVSAASSTVTVTVERPSAPVAVAGTESITVTGFTSGATLKLHAWTGGSIQNTASNVTGTTYVFTDVVPNSDGYYVTQTVGGKESLNSAWVNSNLGVPIAIAGEDYVEVSGVHTGATVELYTEGGSLVSDTPTSPTAGVYHFGGLADGTRYYAIQKINGVESAASSTVTVTVLRPSAPVAVSGTESITVSGFTSGATLKLYAWTGGSLQNTVSNVTSTTYTFTNVVPNSDGYYVTQAVGGKESLNSAWVNSSLGVPIATAGEDYVEVSGVHTGATVELYTEGGSFVTDTPTSQTAGVYHFGGLADGISYYAIQKINGVVSLPSSVVTVTVASPSAPVAAEGTESIIVSGYTSGATLKLYDWIGGSLQKTAFNVTGTTYTFTDVVPNSDGYYVTQTVGGKESLNSNWINAKLGAPAIAAGAGYADISGVYAGAVVKLYTESGILISSAPTALPGGTFRFEGLTKGAVYYAVQVINGVISDATSIVVIPRNIPTPPVATAGTESIIVTNYISGATLKLYLWDGGSVVKTVNNTTGSNYTFTGVEAIDSGYYVTQTVDGEESANSNWITPIERVVTPGGQTNTGTTNTGTANTEKITVDVKSSNTDNTVSQITIERTTGDDGQKSDMVNYTKDKAAETVKQLNAAGKDTARIVIPDEKDEVSETKVNIPLDTIKTLADGKINLQIDTEEAKINISKDILTSLDKTSKEDLYFRLVPVKAQTQKGTVAGHAILQAALVSGNKNSTASVIGNPITIETNMPSTAADITLPLTGITIPANPKEKAALLQQLAVYIEHSDGDKELIQGELVEYMEGVFGIRFHIKKFSTFTVVKTNAFLKPAVVKKSSAANLLQVITPAKASIKGKVVTAIVANEMASVTIQLKISEKATWKLFSNQACTKAISGKVSLKESVNTVYVKITAEDKKTSKVYAIKITRKEAEYKAHIILGLIGSKSYAERVAKIFADEYDCKNVVVTPEGKYYRVSMDFIDKAAAEKACRNMIKEKYIVNYYFVKKSNKV